ncbi:MAG TPA: hypothetical protein VFN25_14780 [Dokdonella sp.]|uniref:hypothetical protein n=1 Tax=Dokdonella sp. TaxID=2291710 RepID=UPI002D7EC707|nr:hypothetical protein [Dokdonella sp.]HET9034156.1 hypothetical protein [Dokdonella sp.]
MKLSFTKGSGKFDQMTIHRDGVVERIDCPKQRIIPHDMVHFAVESTLHKRGSLGRVRDGEPASFRMTAEAESDGVERLVEVFQGDAWSGGNSAAAEMLELYEITCRARDCPTLPVTADDVSAIRDCINALDFQWQSLAAGQSIDLVLQQPDKATLIESIDT